MVGAFFVCLHETSYLLPQSPEDWNPQARFDCDAKLSGLLKYSYKKI